MTYPISMQKVLSPVSKSGFLGLRSRRRDTSDIPSLEAGQVRVFHSGGRYVLDNGRWGLDDEVVVEATHLSVVNMTENKQVRVEFFIPSAEGGEFTVVVVFTCRVHDPVAVVEAGLSDIETSLAAYLRAHEDVFKAGMKHKLADFLAAQTEVRAELRAYNHYVPVPLTGMTATLYNVEIPAPEEVRGYVDKAVRDDLDHQERLAGLARNGTYDRAHALEETETRLHKLRLEVLGTEQELNKLRSDRLKQEQRERHEEAAQAATHRRRALETNFGIHQATKITDAVGDQPLVAYALAAEQGEISAKELAEFHQLEADRQHVLERLREDRAYEDSVKNAQLSRDTMVQGTMMRLEVLKEMVRKGHLDERGIKEIDGILTELAAGKRVELPSTAESGREPLPVEAAEPVPERPAAPRPAPEHEDADDMPYREEDL
ncbi:hypothetical protein [Actinomadura hibisca]|uniref:hypothetical protein n=1 Tax=Actinomadura hibisca TaxID=68565 RepID=UPI0008378815|nr:hypothetical protein [Actinomadura hibisca]